MTTPPRPMPAPASSVPQPLLEQERDRVIQALATHYAYDRLTLEGFEERLDRAYEAASPAQLQALLADLPAITAEVPARGFAMAFMGGFERKGSWAMPRRFKVTALLGGGVLDLREARLGPGVSEIDVFVFMGGVEIFVPPGVRVECSGAAVMGGFGTDTDDASGYSPSQPVVRLSGLAIWGGVEVQTRLPGETEKMYKRRRKEERRRRAG